MSRTKKDIIRAKANQSNEYYDSLGYTELHILGGYGNGKEFKPEPGRGTGITPLGKLVAKNANRSVIKRVRQIGKKEISKELE